MEKLTAESKNTNMAETKLLQSALSLFSEKGYEGASIREIIEGAGVTRPVLYYYFENKEDLFRRLVEMTFNQLTVQMGDILDAVNDTRGRLKAVMRATFQLAEQNQEAVRLILQVFFAPPQQGPPLERGYLGRKRFRLIQTIMKEGLERGELTGGDAQSLSLVFQGIMDMQVMAKSNYPEMVLSPEMAEGLVDLFLVGAGPNENPITALKSPYQG